MLFLDYNIKIMINFWMRNPDPSCSLDMLVLELAAKEDIYICY